MVEFAAWREDLVPDLMARFGEICSDLNTKARPLHETLPYVPTSKRTRPCVRVCACVRRPVTLGDAQKYKVPQEPTM